MSPEQLAQLCTALEAGGDIWQQAGRLGLNLYSIGLYHPLGTPARSGEIPINGRPVPIVLTMPQRAALARAMAAAWGAFAAVPFACDTCGPEEAPA